MADNNVEVQEFDNMEEVVKVFNSKLKNLDIIKYNGISIRGTIPGKRQFDTVKKEIEELCKKYKLLPNSIEEIELFEERFIKIEFPEFEPYYTEEQNKKMYQDSITYLLNEIIKASEIKGVTVTKAMLLEDKYRFVTEAVKIYYKSNVNMYKAKLEDFLNNENYMKPINLLFDYCVEQLPIYPNQK